MEMLQHPSKGIYYRKNPEASKNITCDLKASRLRKGDSKGI